MLKPNPRFFSYTLSKSALFTATTTLAQALAPRHRVNAVAPGPTLAKPAPDRCPICGAGGQRAAQRGPRPDDIAAAVLYLAQATSVTGVTIPVDGGQHLAWRTADSEVVE